MHTPPKPRIAQRGIPFTAAQQLGHATPKAASGAYLFATQNFPPSPQPEAEKGLICTRKIHPAFGFCVTTPPAPAAARPATRSRLPRTASSALLWTHSQLRSE